MTIFNETLLDGLNAPNSLKLTTLSNMFNFLPFPGPDKIFLASTQHNVSTPSPWRSRGHDLNPRKQVHVPLPRKLLQSDLFSHLRLTRNEVDKHEVDIANYGTIPGN
jgi:hypothetical protein